MTYLNIRIIHRDIMFYVKIVNYVLIDIMFLMFNCNCIILYFHSILKSICIYNKTYMVWHQLVLRNHESVPKELCPLQSAGLGKLFFYERSAAIKHVVL